MDRTPPDTPADRDTDFYVRAAYLAFLGRPPDAAGLRSGKAQFAEKQSPLDIVADLVRSGEYRQQPVVDAGLAARTVRPAIGLDRALWKAPPAPSGQPDFDAVGKQYGGDGRSAAGRFCRRMSWKLLHPLARIGLAERDRLDRQSAANAADLARGRRAQERLRREQQEFGRHLSLLAAWVAHLTHAMDGLRARIDASQGSDARREQAFLKESLTKDQAAIAHRLLSMEELLARQSVRIAALEGQRLLVSADMGPNLTVPPMHEPSLNVVTARRLVPQAT